MNDVESVKTYLQSLFGKCIFKVGPGELTIDCTIEVARPTEEIHNMVHHKHIMTVLYVDGPFFRVALK